MVDEHQGARHNINEPSPTGGLSMWKSIDLDESEEEVKGSAGRLYWLHAMNLSGAVIYLKIYNNIADGTTVGTTVPDLTIPLPTQGDTNGAGTQVNIGGHGLNMSVGITLACTGGLADNDSSSPGADVCVVNAGYK